MSLLKRIKSLRERTPRALRPLWSLPRALWQGIKQLELMCRRMHGRWFAGPGDASQIHLSWSRDPHSSFTAVWWTPGRRNPAVLEFRQPGEAEWQHVSGRRTRSPGISGGLQHAIAEGLDADTTYEYRVSNDTGFATKFSKTFRTRTAPYPGPADMRFGFFCDTGLTGREDGNADGTQEVLQHLIAEQPRFVLGAGDYAYANADHRFDAIGDAIDAWFEQYQPLLAQVPMMAQYGNHEIFLRERYADWAPRLHHPLGFDDQRNYSFRVGDIFFCSLFVPGPPYPTAAQLAWLDSELSTARADQSIRWLIVFQHEPIYGHGTSHPANPQIRAALMPIMARHRVDLHLSGHDQSYERTFPLCGGDNHDAIASHEMHEYVRGEGVIYAKISPAGKRSEIGQDFSRFTAPLPELIAVADDTAHHYAVVDVEAGGALRYRGYSALGGKPPELIDSFVVRGG